MTFKRVGRAHYALCRSRPQAAQHFGVSRHTLCPCLERGYLGYSSIGAVFMAVGKAPDTVVAVAWAMTASRQIR